MATPRLPFIAATLCILLHTAHATTDNATFLTWRKPEQCINPAYGSTITAKLEPSNGTREIAKFRSEYAKLQESLGAMLERVDDPDKRCRITVAYQRSMLLRVEAEISYLESLASQARALRAIDGAMEERAKVILIAWAAASVYLTINWCITRYHKVSQRPRGANVAIE